jgi:hypothetical protein
MRAIGLVPSAFSLVARAWRQALHQVHDIAILVVFVGNLDHLARWLRSSGTAENRREGANTADPTKWNVLRAEVQQQNALIKWDDDFLLSLGTTFVFNLVGAIVKLANNGEAAPIYG